MAVAVPGAVPSLCCSRAHAELPCGNARARLSHSRLNLPPLCCCPGLPHAVYAAEVRGEKNGFFFIFHYMSSVVRDTAPARRSVGRVPVRGSAPASLPQARTGLRCSQASVCWARPSCGLCGTMRHHKRLLSLLHFQHLAVP